MAQETIVIKQDIRQQRRAAAEAFRKQQEARGTFIVRLLSSPGAGKTTLLQRTAAYLSEQFRVGILVGDVETQRDADRLAPYAPSLQITTGGACHLELELIQKALPKLGQEPFDFLFIEDIGNLICPASHQLGEHLRGIVLSTTEGDDKPGKYPKAFRTSQFVVINKIDLLPYVPFSVAAAQEDAWQIQPDLEMFEVGALQGQGIEGWCQYLVERRTAVLETARHDP